MHAHSGGVRGFVCMVRRYPDQDGAVFVLCNRDDNNPHAIANTLERLLFDPKARLPAEQLPAKMRQELVGSYANKQQRRLVVTADGSTTRAELHWGATGPVTRGVLGLDEEGELVFDDGHRVQRLTVRRSRDRKIESVRVGDLALDRQPD